MQENVGNFLAAVVLVSIYGTFERLRERCYRFRLTAHLCIYDHLLSP